MVLERQIPLQFVETSVEAGTHSNLSAVRDDGACLWLAGDETATIERLVPDDPAHPTGFTGQVTFNLGDLLDLPGKDSAEEADIEGMSRSGHYLWVVGSHSLRRRKVKADQSDERGFARLARIERQDNRHILARIPIVPDEAGLPTPVRTATVEGEQLTAAILGGPGQKSMSDLLADDDHLAPFLTIPGKDNGLDVEGLAVHSERVYVGLRGPVLRGWAVVIELAPTVDPRKRDRLRANKIGPDGKRYRKHFLDLDGLGIRDMCPQGDDLLLLAGPTMDLDGPVRVYRWPGAATISSQEVVHASELQRVVEVTYGEGDDHAEGMALIGTGSDERLLVVYDSPAVARTNERGAVLADVLRIS